MRVIGATERIQDNDELDLEVGKGALNTCKIGMVDEPIGATIENPCRSPELGRELFGQHLGVEGGLGVRCPDDQDVDIASAGYRVSHEAVIGVTRRHAAKHVRKI